MGCKMILNFVLIKMMSILSIRNLGTLEKKPSCIFGCIIKFLLEVSPAPVELEPVAYDPGRT